MHQHNIMYRIKISYRHQFRQLLHVRTSVQLHITTISTQTTLTVTSMDITKAHNFKTFNFVHACPIDMFYGTIQSPKDMEYRKKSYSCHTYALKSMIKCNKQNTSIKTKPNTTPPFWHQRSPLCWRKADKIKGQLARLDKGS